MSWIKLHRGVFEKGLFKNEPFSEREAWIWLISEAKFEPSSIRIGNNVHTIDRGDTYCSIRYLAQAWSWDKSRVHRFLKFLESQKMIERKSETDLRQLESVITICNYGKYQSSDTNDETQNETDLRQSRDTSETQVRQTRDKYKESKNIRTKESKKDSIGKDGLNSNLTLKKINLVLAKHKLSEISSLSGERLKSLTSRTKESGSLDSFLALVDKGLTESAFLRGETSDWKADFDFFLRKSKFLKVTEGAYCNSVKKGTGITNDYSGTYKGGTPL